MKKIPLFIAAATLAVSGALISKPVSAEQKWDVYCTTTNVSREERTTRLNEFLAKMATAAEENPEIASVLEQYAKDQLKNVCTEDEMTLVFECADKLIAGESCVEEETKKWEIYCTTANVSREERTTRLNEFLFKVQAAANDNPEIAETLAKYVEDQFKNICTEDEMTLVFECADKLIAGESCVEAEEAQDNTTTEETKTDSENTEDANPEDKTSSEESTETEETQNEENTEDTTSTDEETSAEDNTDAEETTATDSEETANIQTPTAIESASTVILAPHTGAKTNGVAAQIIALFALISTATFALVRKK